MLKSKIFKQLLAIGILLYGAQACIPRPEGELNLLPVPTGTERPGIRLISTNLIAADSLSGFIVRGDTVRLTIEANAPVGIKKIQVGREITTAGVTTWQYFDTLVGPNIGTTRRITSQYVSNDNPGNYRVGMFVTDDSNRVSFSFFRINVLGVATVNFTLYRQGRNDSIALPNTVYGQLYTTLLATTIKRATDGSGVDLGYAVNPTTEVPHIFNPGGNKDAIRNAFPNFDINSLVAPLNSGVDTTSYDFATVTSRQLRSLPGQFTYKEFQPVQANTTYKFRSGPRNRTNPPYTGLIRITEVGDSIVFRNTIRRAPARPDTVIFTRFYDKGIFIRGQIKYLR